MLPATSANLGPAFDAAALAMDFYIKIEAREADKFSIVATGRDRDICGKLDDHLILNTYREVLEANHFEAKPRAISPLALRIANDIPIGKGCGSSAAARLAGIALAVHFGGLRWTDAQIIGEASRREHHPIMPPPAGWAASPLRACRGRRGRRRSQVDAFGRKGSGLCCWRCPIRKPGYEEGTWRTARTIFPS